MNRTERLASLLMSGRIAQPIDDSGHEGRVIRPPVTDVNPTTHAYPDSDDTRSDDEDRDYPDDKSTLLFGGNHDDEDFSEYEDDETQVGNDTLRRSRVKLLAGMIWAQLGEPDAVVEESAPNELSIRVQDLSWKVSIDEDGRVNISGFDSGADQYVGDLPQEEAEPQIVKIADHVHQLISEDIDQKSVPPEPPVHFGPDDTSVNQTTPPPPPVAPQGDQGAITPPEQPIPPDLGEGPPGPGGVSPGPPAAPAGGFPPPTQIPSTTAPAPGSFPTASRRRHRNTSSVKRVAHVRLEEVSNQLDDIGESLGEEGEEVFGALADRVRQVMDLIE